MTSNININENFNLADLPQSIIWPQNEVDIPWFMGNLYQLMAQSINRKDFNYFPMAIGNTAGQIQNLPNFGAYLLCVGGTNKIVNPTSGVISWLPSYVWALAKTQDTIAGTIPAPLTFQAGTGGIWAGATLTLTTQLLSSGERVYAINHSVANETASFNVRIVGTQ